MNWQLAIGILAVGLIILAGLVRRRWAIFSAVSILMWVLIVAVIRAAASVG